MKFKFLKIAILLIFAFAFFHLATEDGAFSTRTKIYRLLLTKNLEEIRDDYTKKSCNQFSEEEKSRGYFEAFVTGYCQPKLEDFTKRSDFLCAVALNCSCPNGREALKNCSFRSLSWAGCLDFDETSVDYCHQTASTVEPEAGHIAADWNCFAPNSTITLNDNDYLVTDKGGIIKGRRFDIWFDDCSQASKANGIYQVKIPK